MRIPTFRKLLLVTLLASGCADKAQAHKVSRVDEPTPAPAATTKTDAGAAAIAPDAAAAVKGGKPKAELPTMSRSHAERIAALQAEAKQHPKASRPHIDLARVYLLEKDSKSALAEATIATELAPESWVAWNTLGRAKLAEGDLAGAREAFVDAIDLGDSAYAWNNLGVVNMRLGKYQAAATAFENATWSDDPDDDGKGAKSEPYMWRNLAQAYEHLGRLDEAKTAYQNALILGDKESKQPLAQLKKKIRREQARSAHAATR